MASAHADTASVRWQAGLLTVQANHASRADVLREVARQTQTDIDGLADVVGEITLHVTAVPLDVALKLIAEGGGYALFRRGTGAQLRYQLYLVRNGGQPPVALPRSGADARPPVRPALPVAGSTGVAPTRPASAAMQPLGPSVTYTEEGG